MFERFTERARQVVVLGQEEARALKHNYMGTEHLLLGLLREEDGLAARVLGSLDVSVDGVRTQVARIVGEGDEVTVGQIPFTPRAKKVLELALREGLALGHKYVGTEHVLLGITREAEGVAARILVELGADATTIRNEILRILRVGAPHPQRAVQAAVAREGTAPRRIVWEYRIEQAAQFDDGLAERLTELGRESWELVAVVGSPGDLGLVFKRPG